MVQNGKAKGKQIQVTEGKSKFSVDQIKKFFGEVKIEFSKITWPDKKHTIGASGVVVVLVTLISIYLGTVDLVLGKIISSVLK